MAENVFDYILDEASAYRTQQIPVGDWEWNMYDHIQLCDRLKNSKYKDSKLGDKPFNNLIIPIRNVSLRTEGFDVKDIEPYVDSDKDYHKSFLIRKFHAKWARRNNLDEFIDEIIESDFDYGLTLVKNINSIKPEVVPLQRIAFCDQTNILSGPLCERHMYSPNELLDMAGKWDTDKIDEAITMAQAEKTVPTAQGQKAKTPGKYIEVFELHGVLPTSWLGEKADGITTRYTRQAHYVTYYRDQQGKKHGICLWKGRERTNIYKAKKRTNYYGRACGVSGIEELFEPQIWSNYSEIQLKEMLDVASLMILQTADDTFAKKNKIQTLSKGEILKHEDDKPLTQVNIQPINEAAFNNSIIKWGQAARTTGSADSPQFGEKPSSGTPFKLQELVVNEGAGIHDYRKGKNSTFVAELYRDGIIQYLVDDMNKGHKWVDDLTLDELQEVARRLSVNLSNERIKEIVLNGEAESGIVTPSQQVAMQRAVQDEFKKGGSSYFFEIFEKEMESAPVDVKINIAGKQKNLYMITDKLVNVFKEVLANPMALKNPALAKIFNEIIEYSGLSPVDFSTLQSEPVASAPEEEAAPEEELVTA